jgi:hypothetical protein
MFMSTADLKAADDLVKKIQEMDQAVRSIPEKKPFEVVVDETKLDSITDRLRIQAETIGQIPDEKTTTIAGDIDRGSFATVGDLIIDLVPETGEYVIRASTDAKSIQDTKKNLDEQLPHERLLEIKLEGEIDTEIARIAGEFETVQSLAEWNAKLNIAEVEANAAVVSAMFDSISTSMAVTGDVLTEMFGKFGSVSISEQLALERYLDRELRVQEKLVDAQTELIASQALLTEEKIKAVQRGDSLITIDGTNLEPELNAFMIKILQNIQIQAQTEGEEFLLGI